MKGLVQSGVVAITSTYLLLMLLSGRISTRTFLFMWSKDVDASLLRASTLVFSPQGICLIKKLLNDRANSRTTTRYLCFLWSLVSYMSLIWLVMRRESIWATRHFSPTSRASQLRRCAVPKCLNSPPVPRDLLARLVEHFQVHWESRLGSLIKLGLWYWCMGVNICHDRLARSPIFLGVLISLASIGFSLLGNWSWSQCCGL